MATLASSSLTLLAGARAAAQGFVEAVSVGTSSGGNAGSRATSPRTATSPTGGQLGQHSAGDDANGSGGWPGVRLPPGETTAAEAGPAGCCGDVEVVARGASDAWAVVRHSAAGRRLAVAVEGDRDASVAGVDARVQALCDAQFAGMFDGLG